MADSLPLCTIKKKNGTNGGNETVSITSKSCSNKSRLGFDANDPIEFAIPNWIAPINAFVGTRL